MLSGKKTYIVMIVAIVGAIGGFLTGEVTLVQTITAILSALGLGTLRAGVKKAENS